MSVGIWIAIAVAVVVLVLAAVVVSAMVNFRRKTARLKQHYGDEYERVVSETGSEKGAVQKLTARERRRDALDIVPLTPSALSDFTARWQQVQATFVDDPACAVESADQLVTQVMRQRGYPVDDFDRRAADISVDHPDVVENYRAAHNVHTLQEDAETEQQRKAFVHYRALFEKLLETRADGVNAS
jgi:flagellar basal body-associated protein FliL